MTTLEELVSNPPELPVTRALGAIAAATRPGGCAVVTAPPGTGKTTLLPPAVAVALTEHEASAGRVLVTQPRRVAARAAARRIARLLGEEVGGQVGYSVRGDSRVSERTRVEMVTPGVALRRLQRDPELPGVAGLVIDEFHERDLDTDLALAFTLDARSALREDLFIALTSATLEASRTVSWLREATGEEPALVDIPGDIFPLELRYAPPPRGVEAVGAIGNERVGVRREYLAHVAHTVEDTVATTEGSVLVFLPGVGEIETVRGALNVPGVEVLTLHGQLSAAEQDRALSPTDQRRVILSTSIAESSLTVPGVSVVVDAGLAREPRFDAGRSLSSLVTVPASLARLEQRAGRAARTGPGIAVRVMDPVDVARRPAQSAPGIATRGYVAGRRGAFVLPGCHRRGRGLDRSGPHFGVAAVGPAPGQGASGCERSPGGVKGGALRGLVIGGCARTGCRPGRPRAPTWARRPRPGGARQGNGGTPEGPRIQAGRQEVGGTRPARH